MAGGRSLWREPRRRWAGCIGPDLLRSRRAALGSHLLSGQGYHTSADRLRGAIGATQKTLQSLSCRGQYGCSVVKGVPPAPDCPCIALASCLARAAHGLTDPHVHAQTTSEFLRQPELSAPVGGRALGRRSEGSLLAAELLRAGLEPGVQPLCRLDGLMPVQPCPRCTPARPPRMRRGARARTRAARPRAPWAILRPLVSQPTTPVCPYSCRSRRELLNEVLYACWVRDFGLKIVLKAKKNLPGLRPGPCIEHPSLDAPPRRSGGLVAPPSSDDHVQIPKRPRGEF